MLAHTVIAQIVAQANPILTVNEGLCDDISLFSKFNTSSVCSSLSGSVLAEITATRQAKQYNHQHPNYAVQHGIY
jgi:hypothetical protein